MIKPRAYACVSSCSCGSCSKPSISFFGQQVHSKTAGRAIFGQDAAHAYCFCEAHRLRSYVHAVSHNGPVCDPRRPLSCNSSLLSSVDLKGIPEPSRFRQVSAFEDGCALAACIVYAWALSHGNVLFTLFLAILNILCESLRIPPAMTSGMRERI